MSAAEDRISEALPIDQTMIQAVSKAELDQQITTARAFPRSVTKFQRECLDLATLNDQVAAECIYALPREGKTIEGPSARMAEIVAYAWGNCRAGARVVEEGREFVTAQGMFYDLERNVGIQYEVKRRITNRRGDRFSADMISVTANAACSIALRNAVFKGVPKALWSNTYNQVRKVIAGDSKTLAARRDQALDLLQKVGVPRDRVLAKLGIDGVADIGLDEIVTLQGLYNAIRDSETTPEEAFPIIPKEGSSGASASATSKTAQAKEALKPKTATAAEPAALVSVADGTALIKKAETLKDLEAVYSPIVEAYVAANKQVPVELEGTYSDRKAAIEQTL